MTLRSKLTSVLFTALLISMTALACGGQTTSEIIQTEQAENAVAGATATAEARASGSGAQGTPSLSEQIRQQAILTATALAAITPQATEAPDQTDVEMPTGPALTDADNPTVNIGQNVFEPEVIKVKAGTTVTWVNSRRSASSTKSLEGEAEVWDSGPISKPTFGDAATFQHKFTIPGCHRYGSFYSGETARGAVCVEE